MQSAFGRANSFIECHLVKLVTCMIFTISYCALLAHSGGKLAEDSGIPLQKPMARCIALSSCHHVEIVFLRFNF